MIAFIAGFMIGAACVVLFLVAAIDQCLKYPAGKYD